MWLSVVFIIGNKFVDELYKKYVRLLYNFMMIINLLFIIGTLNLVTGLQLSDTRSWNISDHLDLCVAKIISCDFYRQSFSPYEEDIGMFSNLEDLKEACKHHVPYMRCITRAEKFCEETTISPLAKELIKRRRFATNICRPPSPWQQVYLREANCLNTYSKEAFVHCIDKKIGIFNLDQVNSLELGCKYAKAIIDCSTATVQEKCGHYAGYILKGFLKFHSLSDYKCIGLKVDDVKDNSLSSAPNYDIIEEIFKISQDHIFHNDLTEGTDTMKNINFVEIQPDLPEYHVLDNPLTEETTTVFDTNYLVPEEFLPVTENSDSYDNVKLEDAKPDEAVFPALPKHQYMHNNRTTFVLYEDFEMGHSKYIGCGEADIFWVMLSPLRTKYCTLMDLKSEYSESVFKCTVHIDAPCSLELDGEDESKKAEIFHTRYVITVLTPPNNRLFKDMAVMNAHYLKLYPASSVHAPEERTNLWTDEANKVPFEETDYVDRKGQFEKEDYNNMLYRYSNGSGQKKNADPMINPHHLDDDEYYDEYENWDYYPLEQDDDIYFPKININDVIYIEDINGDLISLHDQRSPIHSKSLYEPYSLFRPRIGEIYSSSDPYDEDGIKTKRKLVQSSIFEEQISKFKDETSFSKTYPNQQEHCTAEVPCSPNSETISKFGIKPGMHINLQNIKKFDPLKGLNKKLHRPIQSRYDFKLDAEIDEGPCLRSRDGYVVTPSTKIELPEYTAPIRPEKLFTEPSIYPFEEEHCGNMKDSTGHSIYVDPDCDTTVTSAPDITSSKFDYLESFDDYYSHEFTQSPYDYLSIYPDTVENIKSTIGLVNLEAKPMPKKELEWKAIILKFIKVLRKYLE